MEAFTAPSYIAPSKIRARMDQFAMVVQVREKGRSVSDQLRLDPYCSLGAKLKLPFHVAVTRLLALSIACCIYREDPFQLSCGSLGRDICRRRSQQFSKSQEELKSRVATVANVSDSNHFSWLASYSNNLLHNGACDNDCLESRSSTQVNCSYSVFDVFVGTSWRTRKQIQILKSDVRLSKWQD